MRTFPQFTLDSPARGGLWAGITVKRDKVKPEVTAMDSPEKNAQMTISNSPGVPAWLAFKCGGPVSL